MILSSSLGTILKRFLLSFIRGVSFQYIITFGTLEKSL